MRSYNQDVIGAKRRLTNQYDLANRDVWPFGRLKCNGTVPRRKRNGRRLNLSDNSSESAEAAISYNTPLISIVTIHTSSKS